MPTIANWNGHTFEVSSRLIRSFTELTVKGACETTDKNSDKQKYVERKYGEITEVAMKVSLNALTGVTDVYGEAMEYVQEATDGACAYLYVGDRKLLPAKMMLVEAEVEEIVIVPGSGDKWISCDVNLTFKQGTKNDGTSGSSGGGPKKENETKKTIKQQISENLKDPQSKASQIVAAAKSFSENKLKDLDYLTKANEKATAKEKQSNIKTAATTGRNCDITESKITLTPKISAVQSTVR